MTVLVFGWKEYTPRNNNEHKLQAEKMHKEKEGISEDKNDNWQFWLSSTECMRQRQTETEWLD